MLRHRDLIEGIHQHLDVLGVNAPVVGSDASLDVEVDDTLMGRGLSWGEPMTKDWLYRLAATREDRSTTGAFREFRRGLCKCIVQNFELA